MPPDEKERQLFTPYIDASKLKGEHEWVKVDKSTVFDLPKEPEPLDDGYYPNVDTEEKGAEIEGQLNAFSMLSLMKEIKKDPEITIRRFPEKIDTDTFDKVAEFSVKHDGTLLFILQCFEYCLEKMCQESEGTPYIGGVEEIDEFDFEGKKFVPEDKPWCKEMTTFKIYYTNKEPECK